MGGGFGRNIAGRKGKSIFRVSFYSIENIATPSMVEVFQCKQAATR